MIQKVREYFIEPELRPEYVKKLKRIENEEHIPFNSIDELDSLIKNA